jgi:hypothetical protein
MEVAGFVIFINVLLLIARGWTITTNKLSRKSENVLLSGGYPHVCEIFSPNNLSTLQGHANVRFLLRKMWHVIWMPLLGLCMYVSDFHFLGKKTFENITFAHVLHHFSVTI